MKVIKLTFCHEIVFQILVAFLLVGQILIRINEILQLLQVLKQHLDLQIL